MPTNPADGTILGVLYGSDAMRAVFDEAIDRKSVV